jgi:hypothetical protein
VGTDPEKFVVLVAAADEVRLAQLCEAAKTVDDLDVLGVRDRADAMHLVQAMYEQPRGCPDVLVVDRALDGIDELHTELEGACPGVRRIVAAPGDEAFASELAVVAARLRHDFVA